MLINKIENGAAEQSGIEIAQEFLAKLNSMMESGQDKKIVQQFIDGVNDLLSANPPIRDSLLKKAVQNLILDLEQILRQ